MARFFKRNPQTMWRGGTISTCSSSSKHWANLRPCRWRTTFTRRCRCAVRSAAGCAHTRTFGDALLAKHLTIVLTSRLEVLLELLGVLRTTQAEVRKVMKIEAEAVLAVTHVLCGVENVRMPELVNLFRRNDRFQASAQQIPKHEFQESLVVALNPVDTINSPALAIAVVHQLELDRFKIKFLNTKNSLLEGNSGKHSQTRLHDNSP